MATRNRVVRFAEALPDTYLLCREIGHQWHPHSAEWINHRRRYRRILRCVRCLTDRQQWLDYRGHIISSSYDYPDGYSYDDGRIVGRDRDRLRFESLNRLINNSTPSNRKAS